MRKVITKIYLIITLIGALYFAFVKATGVTIPCYIYKTSGMLCPGCGTTRMFLNLAKFKFADAFLCNPVVFSLLILWILISLFCFLEKPKFITNYRFLYTMMYISIFLLFVFGILRNIT